MPQKLTVSLSNKPKINTVMTNLNLVLQLNNHKKMKNLTLIISVLFQLVFFGQSKKDLIGTWKIEEIVFSSGNGLPGCSDEAKKYTLNFRSDGTYKFNAGQGFITSGQWKIVGDKINYFNSKLSDPSQGTVSDHSYTYVILPDGRLVIDEYICSELEAKTYYKKQ